MNAFIFNMFLESVPANEITSVCLSDFCKNNAMNLKNLDKQFFGPTRQPDHLTGQNSLCHVASKKQNGIPALRL